MSKTAISRSISLVIVTVCIALALFLSFTTETGKARYGESNENGIRKFGWAMGMDSPKGTVTYFYGQKLAEELDKLSNNRMHIEVYADGTLGSDVALLESCHAGNVTMVVQNTAPQVNFIPALGVFDMPMVYPTIGEYRKLFADEEFMSVISKYYENAGYKLLGFADQTFRVMSSNKIVEKMSDFNGIKIRTMENPNHIAAWKSFGASPTPMAFGELYTGLQQGTVTGQENPYAVIASNKLYEVQDYIIQTNHLPHMLSIIMSPDAYNDLNDAEKALLNQAVKNATAAALAEADTLETEKIKEITASGTKIIPLSDELYQDMRKAVEPVYDSIAKKVGQDLVNAYMKNK